MGQLSRLEAVVVSELRQRDLLEVLGLGDAAVDDLAQLDASLQVGIGSGCRSTRRGTVVPGSPVHKEVLEVVDQLPVIAGALDVGILLRRAALLSLRVRTAVLAMVLGTTVEASSVGGRQSTMLESALSSAAASRAVVEESALAWSAIGLIVGRVVVVGVVVVAIVVVVVSPFGLQTPPVVSPWVLP